MASILCSCTMGFTVIASEHQENNFLYEISVIENATNQEVEIEVISEEIVLLISQQSQNVEEQKVEYDVIFLLPVNNNEKTRSSISSEQEKASIHAKVTLTYSISSDQNYIKVSKISGFWECIDENYSMTFSDREVMVTDGLPLNTGKVIYEYPTTNSFSYDTGWGYVQYYPNNVDAMSGARGYSEATGSIDGMGGSYTIFTFVAVP